MRDKPWGSISGIRPVKMARGVLTSGGTDQDVLSFFVEKQVSLEKATLALDIAKRELNMLAPLRPKDIGLYIGIPFCRTKCLYCSFVTNSTDKSPHLMDGFVDALLHEIDQTAPLIAAAGYEIVTVYVGGGTPTTLSPAQLQRVFDSCNAAFDLRHVTEFTVEAGRPDTIDEEKLMVLKQNGVNRISINPQTMNDQTLRLIGRQHTAQQIGECFAMARGLGFSHINMDVIAGLPGESLADFQHTLHQVEALSPESTTIHTLSIKRGSRLLETVGDYLLTPSQGVADMVAYGGQMLRERGKYPYYLYRQKNMLGDLENVAYAKPGRECLYNVMMMEETSTIVSLGCGGVTKYVSPTGDEIRRTFNVKEVRDYIGRIDEMCHRKAQLFRWIQTQM